MATSADTDTDTATKATEPARSPSGPPSGPQHAVDWLRHAIVTRALRPGERVAQEEVAERIGASVVPVREALRVLAQEGQLTYIPRRGYFVTRLAIGDLEEIYALRKLLEERAARLALPTLDADALERIVIAASTCAEAAEAGEVAAELDANRRFHFAILDAPGQTHAMRIIRLLWDSTEAYRAIYYNSPVERRAAIDAHDRILDALSAKDADALVAELDGHRERALAVLREILDDQTTES
jgi:DNA-binding GntR family transcriptional regulator